jgi:prefoldin beta subunit
VDEDGNVYKLIGPALIKQDAAEAKANVAKRIEFIKQEL